MTIRSALKVATAPVGLSVALAAQPVLAQEPPSEEVVITDVDDPLDAVDTESQPAATDQPIYVTGSRIRPDEFSSPSPIAVIDPTLAVRQGLISIADLLQGSPFAAGSSQITSAISSNFVTNGGAGAQTISLRGLGPERTLVLLNGRRAGPAGTRGAVSAFDLNVLPQSIVQRVEIVKDGASSIYGSDAVAGVVNLITKTETDGVEFDFFGSLPQEGGGEEWSAAATWGKTFDGGHILVSANYYRQNELRRGDRSYLQCPEAYVFTDESYSERADLIDPRTGRYECSGDSENTWGHVWAYDYTYYYYNQVPGDNTTIPGSQGRGDVTLFQYSYGNDNLGMYLPAVSTPQNQSQIGVPAGWYPVGYAYDAGDPAYASSALTNRYHPRMDNDSVIPKSDLYTLYVDAAYELAPWAEVYAELLYNKRQTYVNASSQVYVFGYGADGFGGLAPGAADPYAQGWTGTALFSPTGFTDLVDNSVEVEYLRGVGGVRGEIFSGWDYDVYGQWSRSDGTYASQTALSDALDAANFRNGSCVGTVTPISNRPCVDVDWYSPRVMYGSYTQAEAEFLYAWDVGNTEYTQWYGEAVVDGNLVDLWAGPLAVALGGTYREDEINDVPGPITLAGNAFNGIGAAITAGDSQTLEAFGEFRLPLIEDVPLIQSLNFTAAGRVTNVKATRASDGFSDEDNGNFTYRLGLDWEITDFLRLRGTYGTSYRAPALFEQFLGDQVDTLAQRDFDPCIQWGVNLANGNIGQDVADACAAEGVPDTHSGAGIETNIYQYGGIGDLDPETSKAWTASVILTPRFSLLPDTDISLAVDYFQIEVNDEVAQLGARNILLSCYTSDFYPDDPICDLFARVDDLDPSDPNWNQGDPSNVAVVNDGFINVSSQQNNGVDVTARIVHDFPGDATLTLQGIMTWQTKDTIAFSDDLFEDENGEAGQPIFVGDFNAALDSGPWTVFWGMDVIGATDDREDWLEDNADLCPSYSTYPSEVCLDLTADATFYHSVSVTRDFAEHFRITAGISNLFDTQPPRTSQVGGDGIRQFGLGNFYSQYDLIGRSAFVNFNVQY